MTENLDTLLGAIRGCAVCAPHLPHGPRPVVQLGAGARLLIIGQAPGSKVHASGRPWADDSGDRLRGWLGVSTETFYDPDRVALMPMGFCYPGKGQSGDLPPRAECAPLWHDRILAGLRADRLTLLVGSYAQARYAASEMGASTEARVRHGPAGRSLWPLPHPSWRSVGWMRRNPWFEIEILPALREAVAARLGG